MRPGTPVPVARGAGNVRRGLGERVAATYELQHAAAWLAAVAEATDDALLASTLDGTITDWNPGAARLFGYDAAEVVGRSDDLLIPPDRGEEHARIVAEVGRGEVVRQLETVRLHADGQPIDVLLTAGPIWVGGEITGLSAIVRDRTVVVAAVLAQRRAREDLEAQQQILQQIARGDDLARTLEDLCQEIELRYPTCICTVLVVDPVERVLRHAAAPSLPASFSEAIDGLAIAVGMGACGTAASTGQQVVVADALTDPLTAPYLDLLQEHHLGAVWSHPLVDRDGDILGTFAVYHPTEHTPSHNEIQVVTGAGRLAALAIERDRDEAALAAASLVDPLTNLPNRAQFLDLLARSLQESPGSVAVLFLDLDRFKAVNDSMGHPAGDRLLVEAARRLSSVLRADDVLSRFGGDEFTVLVRHTENAGLAAVADRIRDTFAEPFDVDGRDFHMSVSIGIALGGAATGPFDLIRDADVAMYEAKAQGPGRCVVFGEQLRDRALERVTLEGELRRAIDGGELVVHYQPIFDLRTGICTSAEALVRWQHPERGLLAPDSFIPLAEETGLITRLGVVVLDEALSQLARWAEQGVDLSVSVNVSPLQLSDPGLVSTVEEVLSRHPGPPGRLRLEITETAVMEQIETARASLELLARAGVGVYIDDFGTGYSSIARLSDLPVVGLKIDRHFTASLGQEPSMTKVTVAIIDLAHALDLQVVAEGIETPAALELLVELDCAYGQGFHLGRPALPAAIAELF